MHALLHIAEHVLLERFVRDNTPISVYDKVGAGLLILSGLLSILGVGLLVYASHIYFMKNFETEVALALTGATTLGLAIVFALSVLLHKVYKMKKIQRVKDDIMDTIWETIESLEEEISEPIREHPKSAVSIASVAGYAAGEFIQGLQKNSA